MQPRQDAAAVWWSPGAPGKRGLRSIIQKNQPLGSGASPPRPFRPWGYRAEGVGGGGNGIAHSLPHPPHTIEYQKRRRVVGFWSPTYELTAVYRAWLYRRDGETRRPRA